jgi:small GTP-binding protein
MKINDTSYIFKVWDTAGQEKFAHMAKSYYQRAHGIIVTCSLDNKNSFLNLTSWINSIKDNSNGENIQILLVGNKADLENLREVDTQLLKSKAEELGTEFFETSARTGANIDTMFERMFKKVYEVMKETLGKKGIDINKPKEERNGKKKCCD